MKVSKSEETNHLILKSDSMTLNCVFVQTRGTQYSIKCGTPNLIYRRRSSLVGEGPESLSLSFLIQDCLIVSLFSHFFPFKLLLLSASLSLIKEQAKLFENYDYFPSNTCMWSQNWCCFALVSYLFNFGRLSYLKKLK